MLYINIYIQNKVIAVDHHRMLLCPFCCRVEWNYPHRQPYSLGSMIFLRGAGIEAGIHVKNAGATNAGVATLVWGKFCGKNMLQKTFLASSQCWPSGSRCLSGRSFGSYLQGRRVTSSARRGLAGHASRFARARVGAVKCWRPDGQLKFERWRPDGQLKFWTFPCRPCLCHLPHLPGCSTQVQRKRVLRGRRNMSFCVAGAALRYATLSVVRLQKWGNYIEIDHLLIYSVPENDEMWPSWCWSPLKTIPTWSQFRVIKDYGGPTCAWPRKCLQHLTTRCGAVGWCTCQLRSRLIRFLHGVEQWRQLNIPRCIRQFGCRTTNLQEVVSFRIWHPPAVLSRN